MNGFVDIIAQSISCEGLTTGQAMDRNDATGWTLEFDDEHQTTTSVKLGFSDLCDAIHLAKTRYCPTCG